MFQKGKTAREYAIQRKHKEIAKMIAQHEQRTASKRKRMQDRGPSPRSAPQVSEQSESASLPRTSQPAVGHLTANSVPDMRGKQNAKSYEGKVKRMYESATSGSALSAKCLGCLRGLEDEPLAEGVKGESDATRVTLFLSWTRS